MGTTMYNIPQTLWRFRHNSIYATFITVNIYTDEYKADYIIHTSLNGPPWRVLSDAGLGDT